MQVDKLLGRTIRVDHVKNYRRPKAKEGEKVPETEEEAFNCAPKPIEGEECK
jgi:hypothetical protein